MRPSEILVSAAALWSLGLGTMGCQQRQPPPAAPAAAPAAPAPSVPDPAAAPAPADPPPAAGATAGPDRTQFAEFDRANLRKHLELLTFVKQARAKLDQAFAQLEKSAAGKTNTSKLGPPKILKLQKRQQQPIAHQAEALRALDPDGNRSYITGDHDTNLHYLADEYPAAMIGALSGDQEPLAEVRSEMDKVEHKIESWLTELRTVHP